MGFAMNVLETLALLFAFAVERQFLTIHRKEILTKELAKRGEQMPEAAYDRIVSPDRIFCLEPVQHKDNHCDQNNQAFSHHRP